MMDALSLTFAALANPTRREILARLREGPASVNELAEPFDMTARAVSKHIAVLESAGLVARSKSAQSRPSAIRFEALEAIDAWLDDYRRVWQERFDHLDARLERGNTQGETQ